MEGGGQGVLVSSWGNTKERERERERERGIW